MPPEERSWIIQPNKISLRLLEPVVDGSLPLWEASIPKVASVRFRADDEGRKGLLERAQAEFEMILDEPEHDWNWVKSPH
jgi:hypothetical protein